MPDAAQKNWSAGLACRCIFRILVFLPIAWSVLNGFRGFRRGHDATFAQTAIVSVQHCLAGATLVLFLVGASLGVYVLVIRARRAAGV